MSDWKTLIEEAGFYITRDDTIVKLIDFETWASRHNQKTREALRTVLLEAPPEAADFLKPEEIDGCLVFYLTEGLILAQKAP